MSILERCLIHKKHALPKLHIYSKPQHTAKFYNVIKVAYYTTIQRSLNPLWRGDEENRILGET